MIPPVLIYTGVSTFLTAWAVWFNGNRYLTIGLLAISVVAFWTQLMIDKRTGRIQA
jgi:hypothetical protein